MDKGKEESINVFTQTEFQVNPTTETAIQTIPTQRTSEEERKANLKREIRRCLEEGNGYEPLANYLDVHWPEDMYTKTEMEEGKISRGNNGWDLAVIADPGNRAQLSKFEKIYPEISKLVGEGIEPGKTEYIVNNTTTTCSKAGTTTTTETLEYILMLPSNPLQNGSGKMENVYKAIENAREILLMHDRRRICFIVEEGLNIMHIRKALEYVFRRTYSKIKLLVQPGTAKKEAQKDKSRNSRLRDTFGLVVEKGDKTFVEILGTVKSTVRENPASRAIRSFTSTKDGKLLITTDKDDEAFKEIRQLLTQSSSHLKT